MKTFSIEFGMQLVYFKGGGGSAGDVDYPDHMKNFHKQILDHNNVDVIASSMVDIMDAALGSSPFAALTAYDPDVQITAFEAAIAGFDAIIAGVNEESDWDSLYDQAVSSVDTISDAEITADVSAFADEQDDEIITKVLPRFEGGMRDIGAVLSSAFVLGKSNIEGFRDRDVARHSSKLRISAVADRSRLYIEAVDQMLRLKLSRISWEEAYARMIVESQRIKIVAKKEETDTNRTIDESDARWDLEVFQYGANVLASIGGGTMVPKTPEKNVAASTLGGAMSGAAAGALYGASAGTKVGPGWGTVIGGVLGAAVGYLSAA